MADGLVDFLRADWRAGLAVAGGRDATPPARGFAWLAGWALLCLATGLALYFCCGYQAGFQVVNGLADRLPDELWQATTVLGDERMAFALSLFLARRRPQVFWSLVVAALVATAYSRGLKPLVDALRPPAVLSAGDFNLIGHRLRHGSFPSGHSVTAAVFFGTLAYYANGRLARLMLVTIAVLAGLSRVAVGVHWPIDVAAGLFGGALAAAIGVQLSRRARWGVEDVSIHLAFVTLAAIMASSLLLWDGGYPAAALFQYAVGFSALAYAFAAYLAWPIGRWGHQALFGRSAPLQEASAVGHPCRESLDR